LYACNHVVEPKRKLGNIKETPMGLVGSEQRQKFAQDKHDTLPRYCRQCEVRFACNSGCPKDRFVGISSPETIFENSRSSTQKEKSTCR
jgi:uncharacterized protein